MGAREDERTRKTMWTKEEITKTLDGSITPQTDGWTDGKTTMDTRRFEYEGIA